MEQRLALAGGSTLEGVGDVMGNDAIGIAGDPQCSLHSTPYRVKYWWEEVFYSYKFVIFSINIC